MRELDWSRWGEPLEFYKVEDLPWEDGVYLFTTLSGLQIPLRLANADFNSSSNHLLVVLNAAVNRKNSKPPYFSGVSLAKDYPGPVLSISDPGTHYEGVNLAWYAGLKGHANFQTILSEIIFSFSKKSGLRPLLLGSSGGGFAALVLSGIMKNNCDTIVINPQTDIFRYWKNPVARYLKTCYNMPFSKDSESELNTAGVVTSVTTGFDPQSSILYLQNMFDFHHLKNHFSFIKEYSVGGKGHGQIEKTHWFVAPWGWGHHRVWPEHIGLILERINEGLSFKEIISEINLIFYPDSKTSPYRRQETISLLPKIEKANLSQDICGDGYDDSAHSWEILIPYLTHKKPCEDTYRALFYILNWKLWYDKSNTKTLIKSENEISIRIQLIEWFLANCKTVKGFMPHQKVLQEIKMLLL